MRTHHGYAPGLSTEGEGTKCPSPSLSLKDAYLHNLKAGA